MFGRERFPVPVSVPDTFSEGELLFDGIVYPNISMRLDLYTDELEVITSDSVFAIVLDADKVGYADFNDYRVIHKESGGKGSEITGGYYQQLYAGEHEVLRKEYYTTTSNRDRFAGRFRKYYIKKDGVYNEVKSKGSILKVLRPYKKELQSYIAANKLNIRNNMENAIVTLVKEYETLNDK